MYCAAVTKSLGSTKAARGARWRLLRGVAFSGCEIMSGVDTVRLAAGMSTLDPKKAKNKGLEGSEELLQVVGEAV